MKHQHIFEGLADTGEMQRVTLQNKIILKILLTSLFDFVQNLTLANQVFLALLLI